MKEYLTADVVANNVRMRRCIDDRVAIICEGGTDATLFEYLCDAESCIIQIARDRDTAVKTVQILNSDDFRDSIAIVEADFARILGTLECEPNIFHTDSHDVETMLLLSPSLDRLVAELGSREKIDAFAKNRNPMLANEIFTIAGPIGALRLLSQRRDLALSFKGIRYARFIDKDSGELDLGDLIDEVTRRSTGPPPDKQRLIDDVNSILHEGIEPLELCQGHDCVAVLLVLLTKLLGNLSNTELDVEAISRELRLAYSEGYFSETQLFVSLIDYESKVSTQRIVRRPIPT